MRKNMRHVWNTLTSQERQAHTSCVMAQNLPLKLLQPISEDEINLGKEWAPFCLNWTEIMHVC